MKTRRLPSTISIILFAAAAAWPASYRGSGHYGSAHFSSASLRPAARSSFQGRIIAPRSFAAGPLHANTFGGRAGFAQSRGLGRGFSRGLTATPVSPGQTTAGSAGGAGAQTTGGSSAAGPFVGTANNTLIESPGDARTMTTAGGGLVAYTPARGDYITNAPGAFVGQADKAPTPNPMAQTQWASGLNAITPNSPITQ